MIDAIRRRAQSQEETSLDCRMAASVSDEAVAATHVAMALETVALLEDEMSADDAIMHYVRYFNLPSIEAQIIFRRTLAAWAERHPVREPCGGERVRAGSGTVVRPAGPAQPPGSRLAGAGRTAGARVHGRGDALSVRPPGSVEIEPGSAGPTGS